jgi:hypothetical protein
MSYYYLSKQKIADDQVELTQYKGLTKPNVKPSAEAREKIIKSQSKSSDSSDEEPATIIKESSKEKVWRVKNTDVASPVRKAIKPVPTLEEHQEEKAVAPPVEKPVRKRGGPTKSGKTGNDVTPPMRIGNSTAKETRLERLISSGVADEIIQAHKKGATVKSIKAKYELSDYMWKNIRDIHNDMEWGQKKLEEAKELMRQQGKA